MSNANIDINVIINIAAVLAHYKLTQGDLLEHQDNPLMVHAIGLLQATTTVATACIQRYKCRGEC